MKFFFKFQKFYQLSGVCGQNYKIFISFQAIWKKLIFGLFSDLRSPFWTASTEIGPKNFFVVISRVSDIYGPILGGDLEDQKNRPHTFIL